MVCQLLPHLKIGWDGVGVTTCTTRQQQQQQAKLHTCGVSDSGRSSWRHLVTLPALGAVAGASVVATRSTFSFMEVAGALSRGSLEGLEVDKTSRADSCSTVRKMQLSCMLPC